MRSTVVMSDDYVYKKSPAITSSVRTLLCGAPLFSDLKRHPSGKRKSTQFCNYMPLLSPLKEDKMGGSVRESPTIQPSSTLIKMYQDNSSSCRSSTKHYFPGVQQKGNEFTVEVNHRLATKSNSYELDHVQQYYEKLMCQLTMSNSTLMRENQRYQIRFKQLRMLLEDHIDHLNNIYFTLFLNGFNAIQFPDGWVEISTVVTAVITIVCFVSDNGSFTDISNTIFNESTGRKQDTGNLLNDSCQSSGNIFVDDDDDSEGYLQWMSGQTTT
ncbi:unnamed protein product [Litomosoides sigmodontis]|uniref:Uncharacterized protein n=1 Tax=Litomosoides sigmodontis TaxID=42156 RepID=A0A3P6TVT1_LITSI|nr:unnamed protein product [Litomosoides sigmodontis]